jgi:hypothetical protein
LNIARARRYSKRGHTIKESEVKRHLILIALILGLLGMAAVASADTLSPTGNLSAGEVEKKKPEQVPFAGFGIDLTVADGSGLNSVGHNYRNDLNFYFEPTWKVGARYLAHTRWKTLQIAGRFSVTQNLSGTDEANFSGRSNLAGPQGTCGAMQNPDGTWYVPYCNPAPNDRRTDYSDIWLTIRNPKIYTIPKLEININPSIRFILPSSEESRYATLIMGITPSVSLSRSFWKDRISLSYGLGFTKNFHRYTSPSLNPDQSGTASTIGGNYYDGAYGAGISNFYNDPTRVGETGAYNTSFSVMNSFSGGFQFTDKVGFDALYILISPFAYDHACTQVIQGYTIDTCRFGDPSARKGMSQVLWLTLGYQALPWLGLAVAYINWAPTYHPDGSYRQGVISTDYNAFTTVQLIATLTVEKLATAFRKKN